MSTLIPIEIAAERLDLSVKTLRRWAAAGTGPRAYRIGKSLKYRVSEIEAWIDEQAIVGDEQPIAA